MPRPSVKGKLLDAALEEFLDRGFNGCGVQDITDAAGVPKGSFYNHFKSKEALAIEALQRYMAERSFASEAASPLAQLRAHFECLAGRVESWQFRRGCLLESFATETADASPAMRQALAEAFDGWIATVAALLSEAQAKGEVDPALDAASCASFLVHAWEGAVTGAKVAKIRRPIDDFFGIAFTMLGRGCAKPAASSPA
jgi:TetR/AcrR family transcriptional repressor of nem operon